MLSVDHLGSRKSKPISPYPRSYRSELRTGCPVCSRTRDMVPSPQALSQISPLNFSFSMSANVAQRGVGKKSGPLRSANLFIVGLNPPFKLYVASAMRISLLGGRVAEPLIQQGFLMSSKLRACS